MEFRAAVMREPGQPLTIETVSCGPLAPDDVMVRVRASSICHTDLEVLEGQLRYPMPMILGHEVAGEVVEVGTEVTHVAPGDRVALHWNPSCGQCFYCQNDQPILCEPYSRGRAKGAHFDGRHPLTLDDAPVNVLMYLGGFAEYVLVASQCAVPVPDAVPFDRACLLGCGVMTGLGGATNVADVGFGDSVAVIGCGAIGLAAVQGARLRGAATIIAVDLEDGKLDLACCMGATHAVNGSTGETVADIKKATCGRGADVVIECAGSATVFRQSVEAVRPGGQVVWLGKVDVEEEVAFRWGTLMGDRRIVRSSYGGTRPHRDFPAMAAAYVDGGLMLDDMVTARISLDAINDGFEKLRKGEAIRTVITFPGEEP